MVLFLFLFFAFVIFALWLVLSKRTATTPIYKLGVIGACIEGHYGSKYAKKEWLGSHTVLDIVNPNKLIRSVVDGRVLHNLNEISEQYDLHQNVGPLKEYIIQNFPIDYIEKQCAIIAYYMKNIVKDGEHFHVHVHRGKRMGQKHIVELHNRIEHCDFLKNKKLSFGFGYELNQLDPRTTTSLELPDYYYSISLFIGFDPRLNPGDTFFIDAFADFTDCPLFNNERVLVTNHLTKTYFRIPIAKREIDNWNVAENPFPTLAIIKGILIPDDAKKDFQCLLK